jgi:hypothetical protein
VLPNIADAARANYDEYKDLLDGYVNGGIDYVEFAGRAGRRARGEAEDFDEGEHPPY